MCTDSMRHPWMLLTKVNGVTLVKVVTTAHPEGPRGHVPDRCSGSVEESDAWLAHEAFGITARVKYFEIRDLKEGWHPEVWY